MSIEVKLLDDADAGAWDEFVFAHPQGTFCHLAGWKTVIEKGAGQLCPYLIGKNGASIVGVLPLTVKKHPLFGKALISNMFCVYGGGLAQDEATLELMYEAAWKYAQKRNLPIMEIRSSTATHKEQSGWELSAASATFSRELAETEEAQLLAIPRKQRAVVRKSLKNDLKTQWDGDIEKFYDLYARSVLSLGTPVFPKKLFVGLKQVFGDKVEIQLTLDEHDTPIASLMSFFYQDTVMPYYAGGSAQVRRYGAHDFMYFQLMLEAYQRGCRKFDFGRSKIDSGPYKFKKNWGFEPTVLEYEYRLADGVSLPNLSQQSGPFATLSNFWKKMPLGVSKVLGPPLARHLG